jgi:ParB family chromosome partitioning protein
MARLLKASESGYGIHYALADERSKKQRRERKVETKAALTKSGVHIVSKPKGFPWGTVEVAIDRLTDDKGKALTVKKHAKCPGHAAFIDTDGNAVYVCRHPKDWGHVTPSDYRHMTDEEAAAAEAEAEARRAFEEAVTVATEARRSFLGEYLTQRGKAPNGTLRTAAEIIYGFDTSREADPEMVASLLGIEGDVRVTLPEAAAKVAENRLPVLLLAYAAAKAETNLDQMDRRWAFSPDLGERWLATVADLGYPLTEVEQQIKESCRHQIEERGGAGDEDDEYGGDWYDEAEAVDVDAADESGSTDAEGEPTPGE